MTCSCCGAQIGVVLKPSRRGNETAAEFRERINRAPLPTKICARCDLVKAWPVTIAVLRKR